MIPTAFDSSVEHLARAARLHPENPRYQAALGEALLRRGIAAGAVPCLERALSADSPPRDCFLLACAYLLDDRAGAAERLASAAIELSPCFDRAYYVRARARHSLGRTQEAIQDLERALSLSPNPEYRLAVARLALQNPTVPTSEAARALDLLAHVPATSERTRLTGLLHLALKRDRMGHEALANERALLSLAAGAAPEADPRGEEPQANVSPWGDLLDPDLDILGHGTFEWTPEVSDSGPVDPNALHESWWNAWGEPVLAPEDRIASTSQRLLSRARQALKSDRADDAIIPLHDAWNNLGGLGAQAPELRPIRQSVAEALAVAYCQASNAIPREVPDEELYAAGARYPAFLAALARVSLLGERRNDLVAFEIYVTALEADALKDAFLERRALRALAEGLRLELSSSPEAGAARRALLERLHRLRPGLAFPRLYLGYLHFQERAFREAELLWEGVTGPVARNSRLLLLRARCAEALDRPEQAIELYRHSLSAKAAEPHAHFGLGRLLMLVGERSA